MSVPPDQFGNNTDLFGSMSQWGFPTGSGLDSAGNGPMTQDMFWERTLGNQDRALDIQGQMASNAQPSAWQTGAQTFGTVAQGLGSLSNIYLGLKGLKLQKDAFKFNKGVTNTNLNNSITDYNRRLSDTLANRALNNGQGSGWVSEQLAKYSAKRSG